MLAGGPQASGRLVIKSHTAAKAATLPSHPLTPIEKILVTENVPVFAEIGPNEMGHLVSIAHEVPLDEGATLFTESDTPAVLAVLAGRILLESAAGEPPIAIAAGDVVGVYETLAGAASGRRAVVIGAGRSLRIEREELFELLDNGQSCCSSCSARCSGTAQDGWSTRQSRGLEEPLLLPRLAF